MEIALVFVFALAISSLAAHFASSSPFVSTPSSEIKRILDLVKLKPGQTLYDLGCGDARFLIETLRRQPKIKALGLEHDFVLALWARLRVFAARVGERPYPVDSPTAEFYGVAIKHQDFFQENLTPADLIFVYLLPKDLARLEKKLIKELSLKDKKASGKRSETQIVSYGFPFPTLRPFLVSPPRTNKEKHLYLYLIR